MAPPPHRRALAVLRLRYWTTLLHITRPFLLYAVVRAEQLQLMPPAKAKWYEDLSYSCIRAAQSAVRVLQQMLTHGTLSSLVLFDAGSMQELMQILILAKYRWRGVSYAKEAEACLSAMRSMPPVGWCEKILPEMEALVEESGVLEKVVVPSTAPEQRPGQELALAPGQEPSGSGVPTPAPPSTEMQDVGEGWRSRRATRIVSTSLWIFNCEYSSHPKTPNPFKPCRGTMDAN
jgi:hypothetical protein